MKKFIHVLAFIIAPFLSQSQTTILDYGSSSWKYLDNGSNQGTSWRTASFSDGTWKTGNASFGNGNGITAQTTVSLGTAKKKYITTYFRKIVSIANPSSYSNFTLNFKKDDGVVIYINNVQVALSNMPSSYSSTTKASSEITDYNAVNTVTIPSSKFVSGNNIIAVELHVSGSSTVDCYLDLQLIGNQVTNQNPTANAGIDQSITLPTSSVSLTGSGSDPDGTIAGYQWSQVSGPASGVFASATSASTSVSGLTAAGTYVFQLTVSDNNGATASDQISVVVNDQVASTLYLINWGSAWKYLDNGTDQGTAWRSTSFIDGSWALGAAELGYGDAPVTTISYGADANNKYITYYFRKQINFSNPSSYASVTLNIRRDDGAIVYVNGTEVYRNNLPTGTISYTTLASNASDDGATVQTANIPLSAFVSGANTIAVEIHQTAVTSTDVTFDMELVAKDASASATLTRGPYLQMVNGTAATIRWRTDVPTNSKVELGTTYGNYAITASDPNQTTEHEVRITGLTTDTKYYYRFGSSSSILQVGTSNYFTTAPSAAPNRKLRVAVFGDCGRNDNTYQTGALNSYMNYTASNPAELMLLLGDNAYNSGTDAEYQSNFFSVYSPNILKNHALFPAPGNHDYANTFDRQVDKNVPYYSNFSLPANGECGGVPSGTESYYSFDWGNIHFLSLDSYGVETANNLRIYDVANSPQVNWIKQDLTANTKKWVVAYWHHPPYTMGSHNSDTEPDLVKIRQNLTSILENYGVDMILCGHSHDYERSYLLKNYTGMEANFDVNTSAVTSSSGKYNGTTNSCAFTTTSLKENHGTVYVVSGSAGASGTIQTGYPHNALPFAINDGGMFYFETEDNRLDAKFIRKDGVIYDQFTIMKDVNKTNTYNIAAGQSITLTASWLGSYVWSNGANTRSITVIPSATTTYTCSDAVSPCITDQFNVNVAPAGATSSMLVEMNSGKVNLFPVPVTRGQNLNIKWNDLRQHEISILNVNGQLIKNIYLNQGTTVINTNDFRPGIYFISASDKSVMKKFVVIE